MCGIMGVWSPSTEENLEILLFGIEYLYRRGPEGKGAGFVNPFRGMIISTRANTPKSIKEFESTAKRMAFGVRARIALGQTRYITDERFDGRDHSKKLLEANTQPIHLAFDGLEELVDEAVGVHNGNIRQKKLLAQRISPSAPSTATVDSRYLIEYLMQETRTKGNPWDAARTVMDMLVQIDGAASVGFSNGKWLLAFRDPKGYRPLVYGTVEGSHVFVSESGFFEEAAALFGRAKVKFERSLRPGEMLLIDKTGKLETRVLYNIEAQSGTTAPCAFEEIYVKDQKSRAEGDGCSVTRVREMIGKSLADYYREELGGITAIVPVIKSGLTYAQAFAFASGIPYSNLLQKPIASEDERFFLSVKSKRMHSFVVDSAEAAGATLAVIDDSIVRGDTIIEIYAALKDAGARAVKFFSAWPPKFFQCDYGIDTKRKELIAYKLIEQGIVPYEEGKPVTYDTNTANREITRLIREKVRERYGEKYGAVNDLNVFFAPIELVRGNLTTKTQCMYCVTGQRG